MILAYLPASLSRTAPLLLYITSVRPMLAGPHPTVLVCLEVSGRWIVNHALSASIDSR